ncbi:N-isopropylammelide isopropylaminohydrolase [Halobellus sp. Atlit-38R]|uniref:cytosine deaminase n=1 Tax=Halobellus sp. Atlit-38R TaxID=2282131 RepID=UPI000EF17F23|nr:cytosine deaminase [Halobellus sp. Atlit-38R]RLM87937.1 N-isopropylammelide isopropylaminohydrolase [Halobellus sp. Atlit-38R]
MGDFVVRDAKTLDGQSVDIRIRDGVIDRVERAGTLSAGELEEERRFDAEGRLVTPSLTEPHLHLDYALAAGQPRWNEAGTLAEGIDIWAEYKQNLTKDDVKQRAARTAKWLVAHGVTRVRTHADATEESLATVEALLELRRELQDIIDIEVIAFPQDGIFTDEGNQALLREAVEMDVDGIGAIPHAEPTRETGVKSVKTVFDLARKSDLKVDMHIDETDDPGSRFTEVLANEARRHSWGDRTTASHVAALHSYPNSYASKLISLLAESGVSVITNPPDNSVLQGRHDDYPRRRGHTRIDQLQDANITVGLGHDSIVDPWYHYGKGDPLDAAYILIHYAHMSGYDDVSVIWDMLTTANSDIFGCKNYGLEPGSEGSLVVYDSFSAFDTLRLRPPRRLVLKEGTPVARTRPSETTVLQGDERTTVDFQRS